MMLARRQHDPATSVAPLVRAPSSTPHDSAATLREAVGRTPHTLLIVDFDETLVLCNSTETYLRSARPRWLAALLLRGLEPVLRSLVRGERRSFVYRDWARVLVITLVLPWTLPRWRRSAVAAGELLRNVPLLEALEGWGSKHVITFGFAPVVQPLLAAVDGEARLVAAAALWRLPRLRQEGKRAAVERVLGAPALAGALVVTDSRHDADLLDACRTPLLLLWPVEHHALERAAA